MIQRRHATILAIIALSFIGLFSLTARPGQAQGDSSCPALVELALSQVGNNCANLPRNSACYGFNRVDSTFIQPVSQGVFSQPADQALLADLKSIQSAPLDLGLGQWGIAVLNVQANVPDTLPGQAVTFLLLGDIQVENAVDTTQAAQSITVITQTSTDLRSDVDAGSAVVGNIPAGTVLQADALSPDGTAIRVSTGSSTGWINVSAVSPTPQIAALATAKGSPASPMQAFYFRTGPAQTECTQTPSLLAIQSPENIKVDLTANGADIRLGSLVTLEILPSGDGMKLSTLEGDAKLNPDTPDEVDVPAGFTTTRCLNAPQNLGLDGTSNDQKVGDNCPWQPPSPITDDDQEKGQTVQAVLERLNLARQALPTAVPTSEVPPTAAPPTPQTTEEAPATTNCPTGTTLVHVVEPGENLFRIGLRYSTSVGAIMQANNITDPGLIFVGQSLTIPCGVDIGIPSVPTIATFPPGIAVPGVIDCSRFRATSPLDGLNYGSNTFYWDAASGATGYRVNIYSVDQTPGALVGSFTTSGGATNLTADLTVQTVGYGFEFAWEVQALFNGQVACTSARYNVPRAPQPGQPSGKGSFNASWACTTAPGQVQVNYSGLPGGTSSVTIAYNATTSFGPSFPPSGFSVPVPPDPGSALINGSMATTFSNGVVTANPSGVQQGLAGSPPC